MTVIQLARKAGVGPQTIRYYERRGLLPKASRWPSGYRVFDEEALVCLRFVQSAKQAGFTLEETKELLELRIPPRGSCQEVRVIFQKKLRELEILEANIKRMRTTLQKMDDACRGRRKNQSCLALWRMERG